MQQTHTCFTTRPRQLVEDWCRPFDEAIRRKTIIQVVVSVASALFWVVECKLLSGKAPKSIKMLSAVLYVSVTLLSGLIFVRAHMDKQKLIPITLCLRKLGIKTQKELDRGQDAFEAYENAFERMKCNWYHTMPAKAQHMFKRLELSFLVANRNPLGRITPPFETYKREDCTSRAISSGGAINEFTIESKAKGWTTIDHYR